MAEEPSVKFGADVGEALEGIASVKEAVLGLGEAFVATFAIDEIKSFVERMGELGESVVNLTKELGVSAKDLTDFQYAAGLVGISGDQAGMALVRMERNVSQAVAGTGRAADAFRALGISTQIVRDNQNDFANLLPLIADKFAKYADGPNKTAIAMDLMGRTGARMIPVLDEGSGHLRDLSEAAAAAGVELNDSLAQGMAATEESINALNARLEGMQIKLFNEAKPAIDTVISSLEGMVDKLTATGNASMAAGSSISYFQFAVASVISGVAAGVLVIEEFADAITAVVRVSTDAFVAMGRQAADWWSGDYAAATRDAKNSSDQIRRDFDTQIGDMKANAQDFYNFMGGIFNKPGVTAPGEAKPAAPSVQHDDGGKAAHKLAEDRLRDYLAMLSEEEAAEQNNYDAVLAIEQKKLDAIAAVDGTRSAKYYEQLKRIEELERKHNDTINRMSLESFDTWRGIESQRLDVKRAELDAEVSAGLISGDQELAARQSLANEEYEIELQALRDRLTLEAQTPQEIQKINDLILLLQAKHETDLTKLVIASNAQRTTSYQSSIATMTSGFNTWISGMVSGTARFSDLWRGMLSNMLNLFANTIQTMVQKWLLAEIVKTEATASGNAARVASDQTASAGSLAASLANMKTGVLGHAYSAAAAVYDDVAQIPYVGWLLAPPAALAAFGAVAAFGGDIPSAAGGTVVDTGGLHMLHEKEMVLPADLSRGVQDLIRTGGTSQAAVGTGGDTYNLHVHAIDAAGVRKLFMNNGRMIVDAFAEQKRNANPFFGSMVQPT